MRSFQQDCLNFERGGFGWIGFVTLKVMRSGLGGGRYGSVGLSVSQKHNLVESIEVHWVSCRCRGIDQFTVKAVLGSILVLRKSNVGLLLKTKLGWNDVMATKSTKTPQTRESFTSYKLRERELFGLYYHAGKEMSPSMPSKSFPLDFRAANPIPSFQTTTYTHATARCNARLILVSFISFYQRILQFTAYLSKISRGATLDVPSCRVTVRLTGIGTDILSAPIQIA